MLPQATSEMHARLDALANRFLLYLVTFVGSQFPCALRHILVTLLGSPYGWRSPVAHTAWDVLRLSADALCPLHGFLNFLVYGLSAKGLCATKSYEAGGRGWCVPVCNESRWCRPFRWWRMCKRRYGGQRSTFRSTFRTSNTDDGDTRLSAPLVADGEPVMSAWRPGVVPAYPVPA